jgi:2,3-diaminopropionate biosynthesis protein SbnB
MSSNGILILRGDEISSLLANREPEMIEAVRRAYAAHSRGQSCLPHSSFVRFPDDAMNRIIALPAYLGEDFKVAGLKWISSFPGNVQKGMARASAVLMLNSCDNGHVEAILESSLISAKRTAASAALAAQVLTRGQSPTSVSLIGTGVINLEIVRFLKVALPGLSRVVLFDLNADRARSFASKVREIAAVETEIAPSLEAALGDGPLVSFATTAISPYVADLSACPPDATILHISLRDIKPEAILDCDNIVDDVDHAVRAQTSLHLAEQLTGNRDFIRCTLADLCEGSAPPRVDGKISVFSPFGLGVLDLALGKLAFDAALAAGQGTAIEGFLPSDDGQI